MVKGNEVRVGVKATNTAPILNNIGIGIREIPDDTVTITYAKLIDPLNGQALAEDYNVELTCFRLWADVDSCRFPRANSKLLPSEKLIIDDNSENIWAIKIKELIRLGIKMVS